MHPYRIAIEIEGMEELKSLLDLAAEQADALSLTVSRISATRLKLLAKMNLNAETEGAEA